MGLNVTKNLRKGKKVEEVYDQIKRMIYLNELAPGQKLVYHDLADRLKTSTTPVIQALKGLERSNFVRYVPNKGYFVGEITESEATDLFQAREAIETFIVPFVLERMNSNRMRCLRNTYREYQKATRPEDRRVRMIQDAAFHLNIAEYSDNKVIQSLLKGVFEHIYLRYRPEYLWEERLKQADEEHRAILKAIEEGSVEKVQKLMRKHIHNGLSNIIRHLQTRQSDFAGPIAFERLTSSYSEIETTISK